MSDLVLVKFKRDWDYNNSCVGLAIFSKDLWNTILKETEEKGFTEEEEPRGYSGNFETCFKDIKDYKECFKNYPLSKEDAKVLMEKHDIKINDDYHANFSSFGIFPMLDPGDFEIGFYSNSALEDCEKEFGSDEDE